MFKVEFWKQVFEIKAFSRNLIISKSLLFYMAWYVINFRILLLPVIGLEVVRKGIWPHLFWLSNFLFTFLLSVYNFVLIVAKGVINSDLSHGNLRKSVIFGKLKFRFLATSQFVNVYDRLSLGSIPSGCERNLILEKSYTGAIIYYTSQQFCIFLSSIISPLRPFFD